MCVENNGLNYEITKYNLAYNTRLQLQSLAINASEENNDFLPVSVGNIQL